MNLSDLDRATRDHADRNRKWDALVSMMQEHLQVWDGDDLRSAIFEAEEREEEKQAQRDDECVRAR